MSYKTEKYFESNIYPHIDWGAVAGIGGAIGGVGGLLTGLLGKSSQETQQTLTRQPQTAMGQMGEKQILKWMNTYNIPTVSKGIIEQIAGIGDIANEYERLLRQTKPVTVAGPMGELTGLPLGQIKGKAGLLGLEQTARTGVMTALSDMYGMGLSIPLYSTLEQLRNPMIQQATESYRPLEGLLGVKYVAGGIGGLLKGLEEVGAFDKTDYIPKVTSISDIGRRSAAPYGDIAGLLAK